MMAKIAPFLASCGLTGTVTKTKDSANGLRSLKNKNYHYRPAVSANTSHPAYQMNITKIINLILFYMQLTDIIGILSLIAGIIGVYYAFTSKARRDASFICNTIIHIFPTFQEKFNKIKIQYAGKPISENLVYCKFSLINTSSYDLTLEKISKPLEIEFPAKYKIIECTPTEKASQDININTQINNNKVIVNWDLLKQDEFISLEFFIDSEDNKDPITVNNYLKQIKLNYRIANLHAIHLFDYKSIKLSKSLKLITDAIPTYIFLMVVLGFSTAALINSIKSFTNPKLTIDHEIIYQPTGEQISKLVTVEGKLILFNKDEKSVDTITFENAKQSIVLVPKFKSEQDKYLLLALSTILIFAFLFAGYALTKETIGDFKMNNILKKIKNS